ncbi:MAG: aspartate kinase [Prevotellaceae bacterium]|nr:aspartate kinase [Prevotellaceae bacterium]
MKVYKFGGASVNSAEGVRQVVRITAACADKLVMVVSAMGRTTDKLEEVVKAYAGRNTDVALNILAESESYHSEIIKGLFPEDAKLTLQKTSEIFSSVKRFIAANDRHEYDFCYDQIVSAGELLSTLIVCDYMESTEMKCRWIDARKWMKTDSAFREAGVRLDKTAKELLRILNFDETDCFITQGFIGSNAAGESTTLGREGSDYSAAIIASLAGAESLTVWKDVPGIMNADPRIFPNARLLPKLSYMETAELSYYGAQVLHPKTIKPLVNAEVPMFVKSFVTPEAEGTLIASNQVIERKIPVTVVKRNQLLISVLPKDFSFVLEDALVEILLLLQKHRLKIHLIQSSPLCISLCVDDERNARSAIDELGVHLGEVRYNEGLELITIRNYSEQLISEHTAGRERIVMQRDRSTVRILVKNPKS